MQVTPAHIKRAAELLQPAGEEHHVFNAKHERGTIIINAGRYALLDTAFLPHNIPEAATISKGQCEK